jgi:hypothetical protein
LLPDSMGWEEFWEELYRTMEDITSQLGSNGTLEKTSV